LKIIRGIFAALFLMSMLTALPQIAQASPGISETTLPTVTPLTGDTSFSITIIRQTDLPGMESYKEMFVPKGTGGSLQVMGSGVQVSGVSYGEQQVCFPLGKDNFGWIGAVYRWSGDDWIELDTQLVKSQEGPKVLSCATIHGNGIYALFAWYEASEDLHRVPTAEHTADVCPLISWHMDYGLATREDGYHITAFILSTDPATVVPYGTAISFEITDIVNMEGGSSTGFSTLIHDDGRGGWESGIIWDDFRITDASNWGFTMTMHAMGCDNTTVYSYHW
jgi:hypothetical protein